jgi:peptidoglycan-associated lipoprotein
MGAFLFAGLSCRNSATQTDGQAVMTMTVVVTTMAIKPISNKGVDIMNQTAGKPVILLVLLCVALISGCAKEPVQVTTAPETESTSTSQTPEVAEEVLESTTNAESTVLRISLERIHFDFDQFTLTDQARQVLAKNADALKNDPDMKVVIEGHCDERGSDEYNLALGERRAQSVKQYLVSLGVAAERLDTISYGEELPTDPSATDFAWSLNRRAEFKTLN